MTTNSIPLPLLGGGAVLAPDAVDRPRTLIRPRRPARLPRLLAGMILLLAGRLPAQVSVEVALDQDQFLPGETMEIAVKIANRSGQVIEFGRASTWLTVRIEGDGMYMEEAAAELPDGPTFKLDSPQQATKRLNITPFFHLTKPGRYQLSVRVVAPGIEETISSPPKKFDIITGSKLWEQPFGLPGSGQPPRVRTYLLQQANYLKHLQLYLRITEAREQYPVAVVRLGQMVSFGYPTALLDRTNDLHVLFQNGARSFRYSAVSPDGVLILRQTYTMAEGRPRLVMNEHGAVSIRGGLRAPSGDDFPPDTELPVILPDLLPGNTNHVPPPRP